MNQSLETRLRSLQIDPPEDLVVRALASSRLASKPRRFGSRGTLRIAIALTAVVALIAAANLPAAYFFPRYGEALANAQVIGAVSGPALRAAGLANADLTVVDDTSVSSGHSLHLIAAYADIYRTVLLVEIDGQPIQLDRKPLPPPKGLAIAEIQLTDQFGHIYQERRPSPFSPLEAEPLVGLAASQGARLTVHVARLAYYDGGSLGTPALVTQGDWTLRAAVFQQTGRVLSVPAPGSIGDTKYTVTHVQLSSYLLQLRVRVTGGAAKTWKSLSHPGPQADAAAQRAFGEQLGQFIRTYYRTALIAPDGTEAEVRSGDFGGDQINVSYVIRGPGTYHLRIGSPETGVYDAPIIVPAG
jgi:hypothetical protein